MNKTNDLFTSSEIKELFLKKLDFLISEKTDPNIVFQMYYQNIEGLVADKRIVYSPEANKLLANDIKIRFKEYFISSILSSLYKPIDENTGLFEGYKPNFVFAQIYSSQGTLQELLANPKDKKLYDLFYKQGWENFTDYIKSLTVGDNLELGYRKNLEVSLNFLKAYAKNDFRPLSKKQYEESRKTKYDEDLPF